MLVLLPIGLWVVSGLCDLLALLRDQPVWRALAFYTIAGGILGALVAAIPGFVDLRSIAEPRVRRVGWAHMLINTAAVSLYGVNLWLRTWTPPVVLLPEVLSGISLILVNIAAWVISSTASRSSSWRPPRVCEPRRSRAARPGMPST
jgi:uncharacterized membrane protein